MAIPATTQRENRYREPSRALRFSRFRSSCIFFEGDAWGDRIVGAFSTTGTRASIVTTAIVELFSSFGLAWTIDCSNSINGGSVQVEKHLNQDQSSIDAWTGRIKKQRVSRNRGRTDGTGIDLFGGGTQFVLCHLIFRDLQKIADRHNPLSAIGLGKGNHNVKK